VVIMQHLSGIWADVLVGAAILTGLAACAGLLARRDRPRRPAPPVTAVGDTAADLAATETFPRLGREREWALVVGHASRDLERGAALAALQAHAAVKLAAAEHAFNRLVADYTNFCRSPATSTVPPSHQLASARGRLSDTHTPGGTPERERLAA
jgi:hypothetical protein